MSIAKVKNFDQKLYGF